MTFTDLKAKGSFLMSENFLVTSSPHIRGDFSVRSIMLDVIIALIPAGLAGIFYFGIHSLFVILTAVISCVAFDRAAEFAEKYLHQGTKIAVTGRIQTGSYTNRDGQKVYTTDVVIEEQEFAESKNSAGEGGYSQAAGRPEPSAAGDGFMNIPDGVEDEGLPF